MKPCPWCGSIRLRRACHEGWTRIECLDCGAIGPVPALLDYSSDACETPEAAWDDQNNGTGAVYDEENGPAIPDD